MRVCARHPLRFFTSQQTLAGSERDIAAPRAQEWGSKQERLKHTGPEMWLIMLSSLYLQFLLSVSLWPFSVRPLSGRTQHQSVDLPSKLALSTNYTVYLSPVTAKKISAALCANAQLRSQHLSTSSL